MACRRYFRAVTDALGLPPRRAPPLHGQPTFVARHRAPGGATWASCLESAGPPVIGSHGFVEGPWGDCITAACVFEASNPDWPSMPEYVDGPAGQVLEFLSSCGHESFLDALGRTEEATHRAIERGDPLPVFRRAAARGGGPAARAEASAAQIRANPIDEHLIQALAKADRSVVQSPHEFNCPITQELMRDPVIAADGHSYDRGAIQQWFAMGHCTSPVTNAPLASQSLMPNFALRSQILHAAETAAKGTASSPAAGR